MKTGARWAALAALASTCAVALSACEESAPRTSEPAAAAPDQGPSALMGAPQGSTRTPQYVPPEGPPPGAEPYPPGPPPPGAYPPPPAGYGPVYGPPSSAPTEVIAMAPIPNPPEEPRHHRHGHWRVYSHHPHQGWWGPVFTGQGGHAYRHHHHGWVGPAHPIAQHPTAQHPIHHAVHHAGKAIAAGAAAVGAAGAQLVKPHAPKPAHKPDQGEMAAASGGNTSAGNTTDANATGTDGQRYDALKDALATVFGHEASLNVPKFTPGQAADVTLTVPGDFGQTLRTEAAKQNLSDQAASANLEAMLAGDGYSITPVEAQALPLTLGAPTIFHWKVTPQAGASQGELHADVRANLLGSGHELALGSVKAGGGLGMGNWFGVGLLVAIAAVLIGWVLRSRRPAATGATRPRNPPTI